ncbi:MAG TPA: L,D-transpeptidase family protein [Thermoleophilaceae bacterium]|jgi:lipoprotein-anchoring transpeptidase ErfK/SrfK|nr:L,D-transpeptidase family protein [Thermoleophilaceae bacterium]
MGKRAPLIFSAAVVLLLLGGSVWLYNYDQGRDDLIAKGVTVAGIDVGGMRKAEATSLIQRRLADPLDKPIVIKAGGKTFRLSPDRSEVTTDVGGMISQAVAASREGNLIQRSWRNLSGGSVNKAVKLKLSYNDRAVRSVVRHISRRISRGPKDASVTATAGGLQTVPSKEGIALQGNDLRDRIRQALVTPHASRRLVAHTRIVQPAVTSDNLADKYPWYIVVNRPKFQLTVYDHLKPRKTYPVAVGQVGLETPAGLYHVQNKAVNPAWHVPNSAWAGDLAGKVISGDDPSNPIKARWLGIYNGAGIHGTDELSSLGSAASHGCIRMAIPDVIEVYNEVPLGAPVFIA